MASGPTSSATKRSNLLLNEAFQWFLTALSVRPGSILLISAQRLPRLWCSTSMVLTSSTVKGAFETAGSSWLCHLSRHCFPVLPGMAAAMVGHLLGPLAWTSLVSSASSLADHGALPDVGAARGGLFFAPPLDLLEEVGRVAVAALVGVAGGGSRGAAGSGRMPPLRVERRGWGTGGGGIGGGGASGLTSALTAGGAALSAAVSMSPGRFGGRGLKCLVRAGGRCPQRARSGLGRLRRFGGLRSPR